jgi:hypothetical protein
MIYNNRAGDGVTITSSAFNVSRETMAMALFQEGDKALRVRTPRYNGARSFVTVEIGKVHKTGRLTLLNDKEQWRFAKGWGNDPDGFRLTGREHGGHETLYPMCKIMAQEIREEQQAAKDRSDLRKVGDAILRVRSHNEAASLWAIMPQKFKDLIL